MALQLGNLGQLKPIAPPPDPFERAGKLLQIKEAAQNIQKQQTAQQKQTALEGVLQNAQWDPNTGMIDTGTLQKIDQIDPEIGATLRQHFQTIATGKATEANLQDEVTKRETPQERDARAAAANVPAAEREYQAYRTALDLPDTAATRVQFKMQGAKLAPGDVILGEDQKPAYTNPKTETPKSLQSKEMLVGGKRKMLNFDPGAGKYFDPGTGADVSGQVEGEYHVQPPVAPPASDDTVKWIADQVQNDNTGQVISKYTSGEKGLRDRVVTELKKRGAVVDTKTAATRTKAEAAAPTIQQADDLIAFANDPANADVFGKIGGRWTELMAGKIGTDDPRMARLAPKIRSLASLLAPLHGFRSANAADEFARTMPVMDSPAAFAAAVEEYGKTAARVKAAGGGAAAGPAIGTIDNGYKFLGGNPADPKSWQKVP